VRIIPNQSKWVAFDEDRRKTQEDCSIAQSSHNGDPVSFLVFLFFIVLDSFQSREQQATRLHGMFRDHYKGVAHEDFIKGLDIYDQFYDPNIHFGRTIPLLQSSGTGKSRMMYEMGKKVRFPYRHVYMTSM